MLILPVLAIEAGATIIGGVLRVGPAHMAHLAECLPFECFSCFSELAIGDEDARNFLHEDGKFMKLTFAPY